MSDPVDPGGSAPASGQAPGLRSRPAPRFGRIDPEAIARAEAALKGLSSQFDQWLQDELTKLQAARAAVRERGATAQTLNQLYTHAHDLKGLGATYEYPIVTQIAGLLCRVLGEGEARLQAPLPLVDMHVDAIAAAIRSGTRTAEEPAGRSLVEPLEQQVAALGR